MSDTSDSPYHPVLLPDEKPIVQALRRFYNEHALPDDTIAYHYTTPNGLLGILQSQCIYVGSSQHMNDPLEGRVGEAIWDAAIEKHSKIRVDLCGTEAVQAIDMYVASFSLEPDDLSQWRGYGAGGTGFALGFNLRGLAGSLIADRVMYEPRAQHAVADDLATALANTIDLTDLTEPNEVYHLRRYEAFCRIHCRAFFKNQAYAVEKEVRIIGLRDSTNMERQDLFELNQDLELGFRATVRGIVPYLTLRLQAPLQYLNEVVLGPQASSIESVATVKKLLDHYGYPAATITTSVVPFR